VVRIKPGRPAPAGAAAPPRGSGLAALRDVWTVVLVFFVVMGGIYSGAFTPTEGAGHRRPVGMFLIALFYGRPCGGRASSTRCSRPP